LAPDALAPEALALDVLLDALGELDRDPRAAAAADDAGDPLPSPPLLPARDTPRPEPEAGALLLDRCEVLRDAAPLRCVAVAIS